MPILSENFADHQQSTIIITNTAQPQQHQNAHNDISAIPPHPQHNSTIHFLGGWSNTTFTQSPTPHRLTVQPDIARNFTWDLNLLTRVWMGLGFPCTSFFGILMHIYDADFVVLCVFFSGNSLVLIPHFCFGSPYLTFTVKNLLYNLQALLAIIYNHTNV